MTKTTTKCEISKCRNVGHDEWDLKDEKTGEIFAEVFAPIKICRKHLIEALEEKVERLERLDKGECQNSTGNGTVVTEE